MNTEFGRNPHKNCSIAFLEYTAVVLNIIQIY